MTAIESHRFDMVKFQERPTLASSSVNADERAAKAVPLHDRPLRRGRNVTARACLGSLQRCTGCARPRLRRCPELLLFQLRAQRGNRIAEDAFEVSAWIAVPHQIADEFELVFERSADGDLESEPILGEGLEARAASVRYRGRWRREGESERGRALRSVGRSWVRLNQIQSG
jgi:hypothetical protein